MQLIGFSGGSIYKWKLFGLGKKKGQQAEVYVLSSTIIHCNNQKK